MARFKILRTRKISSSEAEFDVDFIEGILKPGDIFTTYDTHHPVKWTILEVKDFEDHDLIKCTTPLGLCWNDQFAGG
ncbi:MAG: hypothetical protein ACM3X6_07840 [Patescibacteria group bacterium]